MKRWQAGCLGLLVVFLLLAVCAASLYFLSSLPLPALTVSASQPALSWDLAGTPSPVPIAATATAAPTQTPIYETVTWKEVVAFITEDHTNWQPYQPGDYVCLNFAIDVVAHAHDKGIPAWVVGVFFENEATGHAFVAFQTSDKGLVYIEPQTDIPYITPKVGQPLCDLWTGQNCFGVIRQILFLQCDAAGDCVVIPAP